jgi:RNA polymerase sigma factor (sigma-70 family)
MSDIALPNVGVPELPRAERLLSDELLAKLAGRGSARAFAALYERHHQAIYRYCRTIVRNDHDAQDALQSAMMRAYAALRGEERELAVRPWLFRIAHNEAISILRRRGPEHESSDDCEQIDGGVEHTLEVRERLTRLVADLQMLPERQRGALLMRELSGLSMEEIAGALSVSPSVAKQTLFEARSSLHEISEGRAMRCEAVREAISQRDGRVLRRRRLRAHLRECKECRDFRAAIGARGADLCALVPALPASAAGTILARLFAHGGGVHVGGAAAAGSGGAAGSMGAAAGSMGAAAGSGGAATAGSGAVLGGHAATSILLKGVAGMTVLAAVTAGTVHLTAARHHHRGAVVERSSTGAGGPNGNSSARTHGVEAGASSLNAKPHPSTGTSSLGNGMTSGNGAPMTGAPQTSMPASGRSGREGGSQRTAQSQAAGRSGSKGVGGTGGRSHNHHSPRHAKPRAPASSHHPRGGAAPGKSVAKHGAPAAEAPRPNNGNRGSLKSTQEGTGSARPPAGTASEAQQTTAQPTG